MNNSSGTPLHYIDWIIIAIYFIVTIFIGLYFVKKASKSIDSFFLAGRTLPWWLAGTSMVATMFAADTPLFHSGNARRFGLDAGWLFFAPGLGVVLAAVLFARLWRRTRVLTEIELLETRYSGKAASFFRGFNAIYGGIFQAAITLGWVTLAMGVVMESMLGIDRNVGTWFSLIIVVIYCAGSGLWGVVVTDFFQYAVATFGTIYLAVAAVVKCGGLKAMNEKIHALNWIGSDMRVFPSPSEWDPAYTWWLIIGWMLVFGVQMSVSGGFLGQRVYACKDEKNASNAILWFGFCYYLLNGWPWILTGVASVIILGPTNEIAGMADYQETYPKMILELLPIGMRGVMAAAMIAAFMSTVSVLVNWGSSYVVNDFYKRFVVKSGTKRHYVWVSRFSAVALTAFGGWFALQFESITSMLLTVTLYLTGGVFVWMSRWLWWRTNIWSEISAMAGSILVALFVDQVLGNYYGIWQSEDMFRYYGHRMLAITIGTTILWVVVTLLTKPVDDARLKEFYLQVFPPGPGWTRVRKLVNEQSFKADSLGSIAVTWLYGVIGLFGMLFCMGFIIAWRWLPAIICGSLALAATVLYFKCYDKLTHFDDNNELSS